MTDYVCIKEIKSTQGTALFIEGSIYPFDDKMLTKDELRCIRDFSKVEKLAKEHFKLKEEELPWL